MKEKVLKYLKLFYRSYIWLFIVFLTIDIITKVIIMKSGVTAPGQIADWGFVHINYIQNPNAAFGLGAKNPVVSRIIYLVFASLVSIGLVTYLIIKRESVKGYVRACLILIVTGAVGNMIDRIFYYQPGQEYHYVVVDWIDFYWFWSYNFNIADSCIVVAAFMLIIYIIVGEVKEQMAKRKAESHNEKILSKSEKERLEAENKDNNTSE